MTVNNQAEFDEIRNKYKGKMAIEKATGSRYSIVEVTLNGYSGTEGISEIAVAILNPLDANAKDYFKVPPAIEFLEKYFTIEDSRK